MFVQQHSPQYSFTRPSERNNHDQFRHQKTIQQIFTQFQRQPFVPLQQLIRPLQQQQRQIFYQPQQPQVLSRAHSPPQTISRANSPATNQFNIRPQLNISQQQSYSQNRQSQVIGRRMATHVPCNLNSSGEQFQHTSPQRRTQYSTTRQNTSNIYSSMQYLQTQQPPTYQSPNRQFSPTFQMESPQTNRFVLQQNGQLSLKPQHSQQQLIKSSVKNNKKSQIINKKPVGQMTLFENNQISKTKRDNLNRRFDDAIKRTQFIVKNLDKVTQPSPKKQKVERKQNDKISKHTITIDDPKAYLTQQGIEQDQQLNENKEKPEIKNDQKKINQYGYDKNFNIYNQNGSHNENMKDDEQQYESGSHQQGTDDVQDSLEELALKYEDGNIYRGEGIQPQTRQGYGQLTDINGDEIYKGFWDDNVYHGEGRLINNTQDQIIGAIDWNDMTTIDNGWSLYEGKFSKGRMHGYGILALSNGEKYVGNFNNGMIHGEGQFQDQQKQLINGIWDNGICAELK